MKQYTGKAKKAIDLATRISKKLDYNYIEDCVYYNIHQKDYDYDSNWKNYYKIRYNDSSPFFPISDRMEYKELTKGEEGNGIFTTPTLYRGDCYINTFTHRLN